MTLESNEREVDLSGLRICIAIPCYSGMLPIETAIHLADVVATLRQMGISVAMIYERGNSLIDACRNRLVKKFMDLGYEKMFCLDDDIIFTREDAMRIIALSTKYQIVGATYPTRQDKPAFFIRMKKDTMWDTNEDGLMEVEGYGMGFVCIDRSVFEAMDATTPTYSLDGEHKQYYKAGHVIDGGYFGEDIYFMHRASTEFNIPVMLDPRTNLQHRGVKLYDAQFTEAFKEHRAKLRS